MKPTQAVIQNLGDTAPESWRGYYSVSPTLRNQILYQNGRTSIKQQPSKPSRMVKIHTDGYIDNQGHQAKYDSAIRRLKAGELGFLSENQADLLAFISDAELGKTIKRGKKKKISPARIVKYIDDLAKLDRFCHKPFAEITQPEMERFIAGLENGTILSRKGTPFRPETIVVTKNVIRKFYKWKLGQGKFFPDIVDWFDTSIEIPEYRAIRKNQVDAALSIITSNNPRNLVRNKALIAILFDSGMRADELLNVRLKDLTIENGNYKLRIIFSKTKKRTIFLPLYKPHIDAWLDIHPARDQPEAQLMPMQYQDLLKTIKRIGNQIKFGKLTPHSFRHGSITYYGNLKSMSDQQTKARYGWSANSKQLSRYIDQEGLDQENATEQVTQLQNQREIDQLSKENQVLNQRLAMMQEQIDRLFKADRDELERIIAKVDARGGQ